MADNASTTDARLNVSETEGRLSALLERLSVLSEELCCQLDGPERLLESTLAHVIHETVEEAVVLEHALFPVFKAAIQAESGSGRTAAPEQRAA